MLPDTRFAFMVSDRAAAVGHFYRNLRAVSMSGFPPDSFTLRSPSISKRNHEFKLKLTVTVRTNRSGLPLRSSGE